MSKYYQFTQNNTGGSFSRNDKAGIGNFVIIEAENAKQANSIAEEKGIYFNGCESGLDCSCCGDRWHRVNERDEDNEPMLYGTPLDKVKEDWYTKEAYIHFLNGSVLMYNFRKEENNV